MNIDDFLDSNDSGQDNPKKSLPLQDNSSLPANSSMSQDIKHQSAHTDEIEFLNDSISQSWDDQMNNLVSLINQSVAEDDYDLAIQKYLELKELPSKIIEADLKTQAKLKQELQVAHEKLTEHMREIETKHSEQTAELKQILAFAFEELDAGNETTASNLYAKACGLYNELPNEFQARNVKLHYDLLKLFFAIKEAHDVQIDAKQSELVRSFTQKYDEAFSLLSSNPVAARQIHDDLHGKVLKLPNEEIKLKSELLEKLVMLKNKLAVLESRQSVPATVASAQSEPVGTQDAQVSLPKEPLELVEPQKVQMPQIPEAKESSFVKKETPLKKKVEAKENSSSENEAVEPIAQSTEQVSDSPESDAINKLRMIPKKQENSQNDSEQLESLHERAKMIKARLAKLHNSLNT